MKKKIANMFVTWDIFPKINKLRSTYIREISVIQAGFFSKQMLMLQSFQNLVEDKAVKFDDHKK